MTVTKAERSVDLAAFGPTTTRVASREEAQRWCRKLTRTQGENFSVLSRFVEPGLVDDFSAVYAFCRAADDLGDEAECREQATEYLAWWRHELQRCFRGEASHPVFVALAPVIARHSLPIEPFADLIGAFESDQVKTRYQTWDEVLEYCEGSANPVGRLVLMVLGEPRTDESFRASDAICTALQLTNHWQDAKRDYIERDRIYIPRDSWKSDDFEARFGSTCRKGYAPDKEFLVQWREMLRELCGKTGEMYEQGSSLLPMIAPKNRSMIWLFMAGGLRTLQEIERWNFETCIARPRVSTFAKMWLLFRARRETRTSGVVQG